MATLEDFLKKRSNPQGDELVSQGEILIVHDPTSRDDQKSIMFTSLEMVSAIQQLQEGTIDECNNWLYEELYSRGIAIRASSSEGIVSFRNVLQTFCDVYESAPAQFKTLSFDELRDSAEDEHGSEGWFRVLESARTNMQNLGRKEYSDEVFAQFKQLRDALNSVTNKYFETFRDGSYQMSPQLAQAQYLPTPFEYSPAEFDHEFQVIVIDTPQELAYLHQHSQNLFNNVLVYRGEPTEKAQELLTTMGDPGFKRQQESIKAITQNITTKKELYAALDTLFS